jgi:hypothetical protein
MSQFDPNDARRKAHAATRDLLRGVGPSATIREYAGDDLSKQEVEALHGRIIDAVESEIKTTLEEND